MVKRESGEAVAQRDEDKSDDRDIKKAKLEQLETDQDINHKIVKQIEYYFSDVNLIKDKFMQEQLNKNNQCVEISVLATFSRLAQLTKDENVIIQALQDHKSDTLEIDGENKRVRRTRSLPDKEEFQRKLDLRTVHISGFPDTTPFEVLHKYCEQYGEVESLSMRRYFKTKQFKGCIHVVYSNEDSANKVLDSENLKFKDRDLRRESMDQYQKRKNEIKEKRSAKKKRDS